MKRAHQRQPLALLVLEQGGAGKRAGVGKGGLRAQERRGQYHLAVDDEAVDREMVAEQLPAPRVARMRLAEQTEGVGPFAEHGRTADEIAEEAIETHHRARGLVALRAQARAQHVHHRGLDAFRDLVEAQAVVLDIELGVLPMPPLLGTDRKAHARALVGREQREQRPHRLDHLRHRRAGRLEPEQAALHMAVRGDAAERLRRELRPGAEQVLRARVLEARVRMLARRRARDLGLLGGRQEGAVMRTAHGRTSRKFSAESAMQRAHYASPRSGEMYSESRKPMFIQNSQALRTSGTSSWK